VKQCLFCGTEIVSAYWLRKYCSTICKRHAFEENYKAKTGHNNSYDKYHKAKDLGLCPHCRIRAPESGKTYCARCSALKKQCDTKGRRRLKQSVIDAYGGKCTCCGETKFEFLSIDHINGGGKAHRAQLKGAGNSIYKWLKDNNYPKEEFRLLCYNCNLSLGYYRYCPHQRQVNDSN